MTTNIFEPVRPVKLGGMEEHASEVMRRGCEIASRHGKYWLSAGTALGIIRGDGFIPHDTDIDIEMIGEECTPGIIEGFTDDGFRLLVSQADELGLGQLAFVDAATGIIFDIYFYKREGCTLVNTTEAGQLTLPSRFVDNLSEIVFRHNTYTIPNPPEEYCEFRYGSDWKTPKTSKAGWKSDAANLKAI